LDENKSSSFYYCTARPASKWTRAQAAAAATTTTVVTINSLYEFPSDRSSRNWQKLALDKDNGSSNSNKNKCNDSAGEKVHGHSLSTRLRSGRISAKSKSK
jgi:hypothetical protein